MPPFQSTSQSVLSALYLTSLVQGGCIPGKTCKAYPGSPDWPSRDQWIHLNGTIEGRLLQPTPPGAACHTGWPTYDAGQCPATSANWSVYEFHTENPISIMWDHYSNFTCLPDPEAPCSVNGYPAYVVNATTPEHVKAGVDFARENNIRLVVKASGHDYLGRSIAPGSLSIWTHYLNAIAIHEDEFKLDGSDTVIPGTAVTVGAGAQMYDIYTATDAINRTIVGGGGKSVAVGGFVTGGGHSVLAPRYGLAADQVLQMEMVTPSGEIITVNENQHPDLFWAMCGGGGSTFGVLTSITLKTHPTPKIASTTFFLGIPHGAPFFNEVLSYLFSLLPSLGKAGVSGYTFSTTGMPAPVELPGSPEIVSGAFGALILQDPEDPDAMMKLWAPIDEALQGRWPGQVQFFGMPGQYPSFLAWFDDHYDQNTAGGSSYIVSRLLDEEALASEDLTQAVKAATDATAGLSVFLVSGKGVQEAVPRGGSNAVNPGWRKATVHALTSLGFPPFNETARAEVIATLDASFEPLRRLTPGLGAYINEAFPFEKDWQHTFWGENYERLLSIKREVDPQDLLWCVPCVGNERWEQGPDGRLCKIEG